MQDVDCNNCRIFRRIDGGPPNGGNNNRQFHKVCYHWRAGKCTRHPCRYLHVLPLPQMQNKSYGGSMSQSERSHGVSEGSGFSGSRRRTTNFINSSIGGRVGGNMVENKATKICTYWLRSRKCTNGDGCKFLHTGSMGDLTSLTQLEEGHQKVVTGIAFPSGSDKFDSVGKDKTVKLWDCQSGQPQMEHNSNGGSMSSTWGRVGGNGVEKKTTKICPNWLQGKKCTDWDRCKFLHTGSVGDLTSLTQLEGHQKVVTGIDFPSGSDKLDSVGKDETVKLWDCQSGQLQMEHNSNGGSMSSTRGRVGGNGIEKKASKTCTYWTQGKCSYGDRCKFLHIESISDVSSLTRLEGHQKVVTGISIPSGSDKLDNVGKDETVKLWDFQTGQDAIVVASKKRKWSDKDSSSSANNGPMTEGLGPHKKGGIRGNSSNTTKKQLEHSATAKTKLDQMKDTQIANQTELINKISSELSEVKATLQVILKRLPLGILDSSSVNEAPTSENSGPINVNEESPLNLNVDSPRNEKAGTFNSWDESKKISSLDLPPIWSPRFFIGEWGRTSKNDVPTNANEESPVNLNVDSPRNEKAGTFNSWNESKKKHLLDLPPFLLPQFFTGWSHTSKNDVPTNANDVPKNATEGSPVNLNIDSPINENDAQV